MYKSIHYFTTWLHEATDNVLVSTNITEDVHQGYRDVMAKFNNHFKIYYTLIFEQAMFNKRGQLVSKSAEQLLYSKQYYINSQKIATMVN